MRSSIIASLVLHALVVVVGIFGLPEVRKVLIVKDVPMVVEVIPSALATNIPSISQLPEKSSKKKTKTHTSPPPVREKKIPERSKRLTKKERDIVPIPDPIKPKLKKKNDKKPVIKQKVRKKLIKVKPRRKPKPPDRFAMVLKNLEKDFKRPITEPKKSKKRKVAKQTDLMERLSKSLSKRPTEFDSNKRITMSERNAMINAVKRRMEPCWNFHAGSKKAQDIIVELKVKLRPDGRVLGANIINQSALNTSFGRAAGESALRAVLNPDCQPYNLPIKRYNVWKDLKLTFNPREMLGR